MNVLFTNEIKNAEINNGFVQPAKAEASEFYEVNKVPPVQTGENVVLQQAMSVVIVERCVPLPLATVIGVTEMSLETS